MSEHPAWLPPLVEYNDYCDFDTYIEALYQIYLTEYVQCSDLRLRNKRMKRRQEPIVKGKEAFFWHICGEENSQKSDGTFNRHKRIRWPKAVLLNRHDSLIKTWSEIAHGGKNNNKRYYLWFNDEYLVVIEERDYYFLWITAFPTDREHTKRKLQKDFTRNSHENI